MDTGDLILCVVPPGLAIVFEALNPFRRSYFQADAARSMAEEAQVPKSTGSVTRLNQLSATAPILIAETANGTAALATFAPTIISFAIALAAILLFTSQPTLIFVAALVLGALVSAAVWRSIANKTLFQISTRAVIGRLTAVKLISLLIYGANIAVIILACAVYATTLESKDVGSPTGNVSSIQPPPSTRDPS